MPDRAYEQARLQVQPFTNRGSTRTRASSSRGKYQKARFSTHRTEKNNETNAMLSDELKKKLYPGVKDDMSVMDRLEAYNTSKAITLTITTRAIGMGTLHIFACLYEFNNVPVRGSIYQLYRVSLAVLEAKIQFVQRGVSLIQNNEDDFKHNTFNEEWLQAAKAVVVLPDQISSIVNAIGKTTAYDATYVPKLARDNYHEGRFVPQSEQVVLSNLRNTVEALSREETPVQQRRAFYQHNPIPGTIWHGQPENPVLQNPNDVIPPDYC